MFIINQTSPIDAQAGVTQTFNIGDIGNSISNSLDSAAQNLQNNASPSLLPTKSSNLMVFAVIGLIVYGFILK